MLVHIERMSFRCKDFHSGSSVGWAFPRSDINDLWRFVVVVGHLVIGVILVVQRNINYGRRDVIPGGWYFARHPVGIHWSRLYILVGEGLVFGIVKVEATEGIVGIIDRERIICNQLSHSKVIFIMFCVLLVRQIICEGEQSSTNYDCLRTAAFRAVVWIKLGNCWIVVVPVTHELAGVLLLVQRDTEGNGLGYDICEGRDADHVFITFPMGKRRFRSEVATGFVSAVDEILTPYLNDCTTILWSVMRVDGFHYRRLVVLELYTVWRVREVSNE